MWSKIEEVLASDRVIDATVMSPLLSPWAFCVLLALTRHRRRQDWVARVLREHLDVDLSALARHGGLGHPSHLLQRGTVPELDGWSYFFHGCGCCLTHTSGESIDVDFVDDGRADEIDPFFYSHFLETLPNPEPVETDVIALHPSLDTVKVSVVELVERGLLTEGWRTSLTPPTRAHEEALLALAARFKAGARPDEDILAHRRVWLTERDSPEGNTGHVLEAFAETKPPDLEGYLTAALGARQLNGRTSWVSPS